MGCLNCSCIKSEWISRYKTHTNSNYKRKCVYQKLETTNNTLQNVSDCSITYSELQVSRLNPGSINMPEEFIKTDLRGINGLISVMSVTNITKNHMYGCCAVNWADHHLQVVPGLNILAVCKNVECKFYLKDIMCPKGIYQEGNGYCSFDKEIHKVNCPICKQRIRADKAFGFCFFECKFEVSFLLNDETSGKIEKEASNNKLLFAKCSYFLNGGLQYLDLQFLN